MKFVRADNAHGHNGHSEFDGEAKNAFLKWLHVAVARARAFRKRYQAGSGIEGLPRLLHHVLEASAAAIVFVRHRLIFPEASHHPAIDGNFEMRCQLESADELRDGGINHEWIEEIYMVADKKTGAHGIKSRGTPHFEFHSSEPQNIAKENPLRAVVFPRIHDHSERNKQSAKHEEMQAAHGPK